MKSVLKRQRARRKPLRRLLKRLGVRMVRKATARLRLELKELEREANLAPF